MTTEPSTPNWHTSSYSGTQENCVQIAHTAPAVLVGDSKRPEGTPITLRAPGFGALRTALGTTR